MVLAGCGGSSGSSGASGATCPDGGTIDTYANFGSGLMTSQCTRCHGASDSEGGIQLDTQARVQAHIAEIDRQAAAGPNGTNTAMPQGGTAPTDDERTRLGEWLACGAN
ncbi:MAG: c-type cytochrome [Deltaproteobacteria bacterium]|nr:c-type cytochrome [Deltaproteobacteria bacterium]